MHGIGFGLLILVIGFVAYSSHKSRIKKQVILAAKEEKVSDVEAQKELEKPVKLD